MAAVNQLGVMPIHEAIGVPNRTLDGRRLLMTWGVQRVYGDIVTAYDDPRNDGEPDAQCVTFRPFTMTALPGASGQLMLAPTPLEEVTIVLHQSDVRNVIRMLNGEQPVQVAKPNGIIVP